MSNLFLGAALGATGAFVLDLRRQRARWVVAGAGAATMLYALARGGFGALVPLALGAALFARSIKASGSSRRSASKA